MTLTTQWTTEEIISAVNGHILTTNGHDIFKHISIDSRQVSSEHFFIGINGPNHKGINFLSEIIKKNVRGILIEKNDIKEINLKKIKENRITCIIVDDTVRALGDLAKYHRKRLNLKVVAVTGSIGKTTTCQMISKIFEQKYSTTSTSGNMNNHIGVPLTLLKIGKHHDVVVVELGMSNLGEIDRLSEICQPDIGIITNVAPAHLASLGSLENIAKAKSELMMHIKSTGSIALNIDDPLVRAMSNTTQLNVFFFGISKNAKIIGKNLSLKASGIDFSLETPNGQMNIELPIPSKALVNNALAASAAGILLNCSNKEIKIGLESFKIASGRMKNIKTKIIGLEIIDDTYNSNPASVKNAIETIKSIKNNRFTIIIIGDMLELGSQSKFIHQKVGKLVAQAKINRLYATGTFAKDLIEGALQASMPINKTYIGSKQNIIDNIKKYIRNNCIILVKGSRKMKMEKIPVKIAEICNKIN